MIIKILKLIFYYFLLLLGLSCVSWIIWTRFIRERVIRDIPDPFLTEYRFWILLYICCIYLYVIKNLVKPKESPIPVEEIFNIIYKPLTTLDHFIKYNKYIKPYYYELMINFVKYFDILESKYQNMKFIIFFMQIFPRMILVSFLVLDTFYFHKLEILYKIVLIGILPLILRYIKYSLKDIIKQWILELENKYSKVKIYEENYKLDDNNKKTTENSYHGEIKTIQEYIEIKYQNILDFYVNKVTYKYESTPVCDFEILKQYFKIEIITRKDIASLRQKDYKILNELYYKLMPSIIKLKLIFFFLEIINEENIIYWFKIIIFALYFICWSYILIISYWNYPVELFMGKYLLVNFIRYLNRLDDPFSDSDTYSKNKNLVTKNTIKYKLQKLLEKIYKIYKIFKK